MRLCPSTYSNKKYYCNEHYILWSSSCHMKFHVSIGNGSSTLETTLGAAENLRTKGGFVPDTHPCRDTPCIMQGLERRRVSLFSLTRIGRASASYLRFYQNLWQISLWHLLAVCPYFAPLPGVEIGNKPMF